jgi:hypothetical protein
MRPVRVPLRNGQPARIVSAPDQSWAVHAVRSVWHHDALATIPPGQETTCLRLLVEGPLPYATREEGFFEVLLRQFTIDGTWWMDTT